MANHASASNLCRGSCSVHLETKGCFIDVHSNRALPHYIYNERDPSINNYGGRRIDWLDWNNYFVGFICRCAEKAQHLGYDLIGAQFYGECWAGHSSQHDYAQYGADYPGCIEDDYQPCTEYSRYCVGRNWRNMVFKLVNPSCPGIYFEKIGCYKDKHRSHERPLPDYLFNDRDPSIDNFSGQRIDWRNWDIYVPNFACRCAKAARDHNATVFGMQFYGECWSGQNGHETYFQDGGSSNCIDQCYAPCTRYREFCSGQNFANYVYRIKEEQYRNGEKCEIDISPVGCYAEDPYNLAMPNVFYNEAEPSKPNFGGSLLQWSTNYNADFRKFLCKCAHLARSNRWEYFGVRELGLCVSNPQNPSNYHIHQASDQCFVGQNSSSPCPSGSKLCGGLTEYANYVYQIVLV